MAAVACGTARPAERGVSVDAALSRDLTLATKPADAATRAALSPDACASTPRVGAPANARDRARASEELRLGLEAERTGDMERALTRFDAAHRLDASNDAALNHLAHAQEFVAEYDDAVRSYCHLLALPIERAVADDASWRLARLVALGAGDVHDDSTEIRGARAAVAAHRSRVTSEGRLAAAPSPIAADAPSPSRRAQPEAVPRARAEVAPAPPPIDDASPAPATIVQPAIDSTHVAVSSQSAPVADGASDGASSGTTRTAPARTSATHTARGAAIGAVAGAIAGVATRRSAKSAIIGAAIGGVLGAAIEHGH